MSTKLRSGFTLVELLVVIAIIGILSSVVLASMNTARIKGNDAAIKGELKNIQAQAQIYRDENNGYYPSFVDGDPIVDNCANTEGLMSDTYIINQLAALNGRFNATTTCMVGTSTYAVSATLQGGGGWCIDFEGNSTSSIAGNDGSCQ